MACMVVDDGGGDASVELAFVIVSVIIEIAMRWVTWWTR